MENQKLYEAIADIAFIAGYRRYNSGDSRLDMSNFIFWATEFEQMNEVTEWGERDYMIEIEEFANKKIDIARKDNDYFMNKH